MEMFRQPRSDYRPTRRKNAVPVRLIADGEDIAATLMDISRDGAKLHTPFAILPGTAVELKINAVSVPALVQWFNAENVGLRFLERLGRDTLITLEAREDDGGDLD